MDINRQHLSSYALTLVVCVACAVGPAGVGAAEHPILVKLTDEQIRAMEQETPSELPERSLTHPKIGTALLEISNIAQVRGDWRSTAANRGLLVEGESVLVEIRLDPDSARATEWYLESLGGRVRHHNVPSLIELWLPVNAIEKSAAHKDIHLIRRARLVEPTVGSVTSEGVAALNVNTSSVTYDYHDLGADGSGVVVADIDAGYRNYASLQVSGDWPQPANLRRFEVNGGPVVDCDVAACSGYSATSSNHGAATMEIVFDLAPGADYLTYATTTVGDWYAALIDAADRGADVITESLSAPLDGVGDGSECPPIWSAPCGSIAEAAAYARAQGSLVVNSAANYGTEHWGGTYVDTGSGALNWGGGGDINIGGPFSGSVFCVPDGTVVSVDLFWDDWTAPVDHDYDLFVYEYRGTDPGWVQRTSSTVTQNGGAGQAPQEAIRWVSSLGNGGGICANGTGIYGILVARISAATDRHLQVFANDWGGLWNLTEDRSLGFPADSPHVYTVGAVNVASPATLESYSSEGPALGPGGSAAQPSPANPKPDGVSVAQVSTVAYGPTAFAGTSASAPHVAGVAALLIQLRNEKYSTPPATKNPEGIHSLLSTFALEDPTFPSTFATTYGNGLVKLRFCDQSVGVSNNEWIMLGLPCTRRDSSTVAEVLGDDLDLVGTYWEVWDWDGENAVYRQLVETDQMRPGVGYWLLYEGDATVDIQGLVQDRSESYPFNLFGETSTYGRANFLGHAFEFDVAWPDVTVIYAGGEHTLADAINDGVMRNFMWKPYTATGYVEHDGLLGEGTLHGFNGFWVKAFQDTELRVPTSLAAETTGDSGRIGQTVGWSVSLQATALGVTAHARIGQLPDSLETWDLHDAEHMPSFEEHQLSVVMPHPEWGEFAGDYVRDYHPWGRTDAWRFEVRSNLKAKVVLRWDGPMSVMEQSVIVDLETGKTIPLIKLQNEGYGFKMTPGTRGFLWRVR